MPGEHRVLRERAWICRGIRQNDRGPRLKDVSCRARGRRHSASDHGRGGLSPDCAHSELVALHDVDCAGVGGEQGRRLVGDLVQDRGRVELRGKEAAHPGELLGKRPRGALTLVELAPLEGSARRAREPAAELEVVVAERALLGEEDDDDASVLAARGIDRDRQERAHAGLPRKSAPVVSEPVVVVQRGGGQEPPVACRTGEDCGRLRHAFCESLRDLARKAVKGYELEPTRAWHEHRRKRAAQSLARSMRHGVQRRRLRQRLRERRGDPVEPSLHARLAHALLEARRVPNGERGKPREGLEQIGLELVETALGVASGHTEHAAGLSGPRHRRGNRTGKAVVGRMRDRLPEAISDLALCRKLELEKLGIEPVHGCTAKEGSVGVVEVAVGRVGIEELGHLDDEPLEHGLEPQLAGDDLGGLEERRLVVESLRVLHEELRRVNCDPQLSGDGLRQRDLGLRPVAGL